MPTYFTANTGKVTEAYQLYYNEGPSTDVFIGHDAHKVDGLEPFAVVETIYGIHRYYDVNGDVVVEVDGGTEPILSFAISEAAQMVDLVNIFGKQ